MSVQSNMQLCALICDHALGKARILVAPPLDSHSDRGAGRSRWRAIANLSQAARRAGAVGSCAVGYALLRERARGTRPRRATDKEASQRQAIPGKGPFYPYMLSELKDRKSTRLSTCLAFQGSPSELCASQGALLARVRAHPAMHLCHSGGPPTGGGRSSLCAHAPSLALRPSLVSLVCLPASFLLNLLP